MNVKFYGRQVSVIAFTKVEVSVRNKDDSI